jgi:hypothetical protein
MAWDGMMKKNDKKRIKRTNEPDSVNKLKKSNVASLLMQIAEAIEKEDYSLIGLPIDMDSLASLAAKARSAGNKPN